MFELHAQLSRDCTVLGRFPLCLLLLMNDANYPWFILVPQRDGLRELHDLADGDRVRLWEESALLSRGLSRGFNAHKLNVAALGNQVPQLHVHHIVRFTHDPAWPQPVWGRVPPKPYYDAEIPKLRTRMQELLGPSFEAA